MDRLKNIFGGQPESAAANDREDDESASLINESTPSTSAGVFSKGSEMLEQLETGPDYKIAGVFLVFAVLFFFAAVTALPFILVSPRSFNLYFCFGSIFLQLALAFFYAPMAYLKKLFQPENRIISSVYILSLLVDFYFIWAGAGYLLSIVLVLLQGCSLAWFVVQAVGGGSRANSWAYALIFSSLVGRVKGVFGGSSSSESSLPF